VSAGDVRSAAALLSLLTDEVATKAASIVLRELGHRTDHARARRPARKLAAEITRFLADQGPASAAEIARGVRARPATVRSLLDALPAVTQLQLTDASRRRLWALAPADVPRVGTSEDADTLSDRSLGRPEAAAAGDDT